MWIKNALPWSVFLPGGKGCGREEPLKAAPLNEAIFFKRVSKDFPIF